MPSLSILHLFAQDFWWKEMNKVSQFLFCTLLLYLTASHRLLFASFIFLPLPKKTNNLIQDYSNIFNAILNLFCFFVFFLWRLCWWFFWAGVWQKRFCCLVPHMFLYYFENDVAESPRYFICDYLRYWPWAVMFIISIDYCLWEKIRQADKHGQTWLLTPWYDAITVNANQRVHLTNASPCSLHVYFLCCRGVIDLEYFTEVDIQNGNVLKIAPASHVQANSGFFFQIDDATEMSDWMVRHEYWTYSTHHHSPFLLFTHTMLKQVFSIFICNHIHHSVDWTRLLHTSSSILLFSGNFQRLLSYPLPTTTHSYSHREACTETATLQSVTNETLTNNSKINSPVRWTWRPRCWRSLPWKRKSLATRWLTCRERLPRRSWRCIKCWLVPLSLRWVSNTKIYCSTYTLVSRCNPLQ